MDSLTAMELRNRLQTELGRPLPTTLTFKYPTLRTLAGYLVQEHLRPRDGEGPSPDPATCAAGPQVDAALVEELESLEDLLDGTR